MINLYAKIAIFLFVFLLSGCEEINSENKKEFFDLQVSFFDKELADIVVSELDKRNIKHIRESDTNIRYLVVDSQKVTNLVYEVNMNDLPTGRSINISSEASSQKFEKGLAKKNVEYVVKYRKGLKWIVWAEDKQSEGQTILDKILIKDKEMLVKRINGR